MAITIVTTLSHAKAAQRILRLGTMMYIIWGAQYIVAISGLLLPGYSKYAMNIAYVAFAVLSTILVCTALIALNYWSDDHASGRDIESYEAGAEKA